MNGRIALEGLEFHAFHGVYPHERESGNWFEVDISVETDFSAAAQRDDLEGTVNYEALYSIVKGEMEKPSKLLESVAEKIVNDVLRELKAVILVYSHSIFVLQSQPRSNTPEQLGRLTTLKNYESLATGLGLSIHGCTLHHTERSHKQWCLRHKIFQFLKVQ